MKMKIYKLIFTLAILVGFTIPGDVVAKESENAGGNAPRPFLMQTDEGTGGNITYVNINGIASFFDRDGITGFNTLTDGSGTYYPPRPGGRHLSRWPCLGWFDARSRRWFLREACRW
jgi:hypothetical protein